MDNLRHIPRVFCLFSAVCLVLVTSACVPLADPGIEEEGRISISPDRSGLSLAFCDAINASNIWISWGQNSLRYREHIQLPAGAIVQVGQKINGVEPSGAELPPVSAIRGVWVVAGETAARWFDLEADPPLESGTWLRWDGTRDSAPCN